MIIVIIIIINNHHHYDDDDDDDDDNDDDNDDDDDHHHLVSVTPNSKANKLVALISVLNWIFLCKKIAISYQLLI